MYFSFFFFFFRIAGKFIESFDFMESCGRENLENYRSIVLFLFFFRKLYQVQIIECIEPISANVKLFLEIEGKGDLFRIYFSFRIDGKLMESCILLSFSKIVEKIFVATTIKLKLWNNSKLFW